MISWKYFLYYIFNQRVKFILFLQTLLEGSVTLEMEVRPRFLVPDTNCFIEHLDLIKALVNCTPYTVMVPLVGKGLASVLCFVCCLLIVNILWCVLSSQIMLIILLVEWYSSLFFLCSQVWIIFMDLQNYQINFLLCLYLSEEISSRSYALIFCFIFIKVS